MGTDRLQAIDRQIEQLKARRAQIAARERERERKADTRRKILIGAGLIQYARNDDMARDTLTKVLQGLRQGERNRELFDGWKPYPDWEPAVFGGIPSLGDDDDGGLPGDAS